MGGAGVEVVVGCAGWGVRVAVAVPLAGRSGALVGALPLERSAIVGAIDDLLASSQMQAALVDGQDRPIYRVAAADSAPGIDLAHAQHQAGVHLVVEEAVYLEDTVAQVLPFCPDARLQLVHRCTSLCR